MTKTNTGLAEYVKAQLEKAMAYNLELLDALQLIYDELDQGQRKKIMRNPTIKALYVRLGIGGNDE